MKKALIFTSLLTLGACAGNPSAPGQNDAKNFPALIQEAEIAVRTSGEAGSEWRDASLLIGQAKMAAANGDMKTAMELATQAKRQGELSAQQAQEQKNARPWLF